MSITLLETENLNVEGLDTMPSPRELKARVPLSDAAARTVAAGRSALFRILEREDKRLFIVVGPCSIHDPVAGLEYAHRLHALAREVSETLVLVMRVYFEKPRTVSGWKGFINDPRMDDSFHIEEGMQRARAFLSEVAELGLPTATEALDPIAPQYLGDLVSWYAIGARTSESQTHREMASGLSAPVGFKNGTDGDIEVAINAIRSSRQPHSFLGINQDGGSAIVRTRGNRHGHIVLRGGHSPNYDTAHVALTEAALHKAGVEAGIVIDCSHANSFKKPELQPLVFRDCVHQVVDGNGAIVGMMLESNLVAGNQPIPKDLSQLIYGCSVTDACIDWDTTVAAIREAHQSLAAARKLPARS
jgi:3-deoxy-7-phosphoheptulonate synthase